MEGHVYKQIEITGTSKNSVEEAIQTAIDRASKTLHHLCWFEVVETRGAIKEGKISEYQVTIKIGFRLDE